jgi:hypothetical protein
MKQKKAENKINLETLAGGAFAEKLNEALLEVAENIQNPNTEATAKRGITINIKLAPNKSRQQVSTQISVATKLAPTEALDTMIVMGTNMKTGGVEIAEYDTTHGQLSMLDTAEDEEELEEEQKPAQAPTLTPGKVVDLRKRRAPQEANTPLVPGRDYDTETGEVYEEAEQA